MKLTKFFFGGPIMGVIKKFLSFEMEQEISS